MVSCRIRSINVKVVGAEDVVVENMHSQSVFGDKVAPNRLFGGVASIRPRAKLFGTEHLQKRDFCSEGVRLEIQGPVDTDIPR